MLDEDHYLAHAARQSSAAAEAEKVWLASLPEPMRIALSGAARKNARENLGEDEDASLRAVSHWDVASAVDTVPDELAEAFDLTAGQAEGVFAWHLSRLKAEVDREKGMQLGRIVGLLIKPAHDIRVVIYGLLFAAKLGALNGIASQTAAADELGLHRASVSHWKRVWQKLLDLRDETYGKQESARRRMSESRHRYVANKRALRRAGSVE